MKRALPLLAAALLLAAPVAAQAQSPRPEITSLKGLIARYSSEGCKECHPKVYAQWAGSQHARPLMGMDDQVFLTRYLKEGPMALAKGAKATRDNLMCVKCHLPQVLEAPGGVSEAVLDELAQAILKNDKATLRQLNIGCPVCHQDKAVVHGRAERGVIYGSKDIPGHPGSPVKKSPLLKNSLHCGQCHGLGPVLDFHNPQQCATLYGSHLHAYIPSGGTQTCQDCHLPRGDHSMPPNFNDRAQTSALYRAALPLEVSVQGYTFQPKEEDKRPLLVVRTKVSNKAGHRIPDG
jgi:hypothetical protein